MISSWSWNWNQRTKEESTGPKLSLHYSEPRTMSSGYVDVDDVNREEVLSDFQVRFMVMDLLFIIHLKVFISNIGKKVMLNWKR